MDWFQRAPNGLLSGEWRFWPDKGKSMCEQPGFKTVDEQTETPRKSVQPLLLPSKGKNSIYFSLSEVMNQWPS